MIFHVPAVPMYPTRKEITISAFVQKVYNFCEYMTKEGHTVYHYGHPDSEVNCTDHFDCITKRTYNKDYGNKSWKEMYNEDIETATHIQLNEKAAKCIKEKKKSDNEFILAFWGMGHKELCDKNSEMFIVEPSIGYDSMFAPYRVFETYTHMHLMLGLNKEHYPRPTDHVIPPGFNLDDFTFKKDKQDYLLYMGRMVDAKGISIAQGVSEVTKIPIKFVGPQNQENQLVMKNPLAEYIHTVSFEERKELLANAKCLLAPSLYMEPCGWIAIEAMLSGTPVICTDFGGFSQYVLQARTGFRCKDINEFCHAVFASEKLDNEHIRDYAVNKFSIKKQMDGYTAYFEYLQRMRDSGNHWGKTQKKCLFTVFP